MSSKLVRCAHIRENEFPIDGWQPCACGECFVLDFAAHEMLKGVYSPAVRLSKQDDKWQVSVWSLGIQHVELSADTELPADTAKEMALAYVEQFIVGLLEAFEQARERA